MSEPKHLEQRDRLAFRFRVAGALAGLALFGGAFATSSWNEGWMVGLVVLATVGGAVAYHLLTSIVRCPGCGSRLTNFRISGEPARGKRFACKACGATAFLKEGFFWQSEFSG